LFPPADQRTGFPEQLLLDKLRAADRDPQRLWNKLFDSNLQSSSLLTAINDAEVSVQLPPNIRPLPSKIASEDVRYLRDKGALSLPRPPLQNALVQAYIEYVHPYMPLLDLRDFLQTVNATDGMYGQTSLFLYQAVMFAATAFVDMKYLREGGYQTRKAARKSFFQKTRVSRLAGSLPLPPPAPCLDIIFTCFFFSVAAVRLRLRARPARPRAGPPSHDVLV
jgi:hypothetical protein